MKPRLLPLLGAFSAGIAATIAFQTLTQGPPPPSSPPTSPHSTPPASTTIPIGKAANSPKPTTILTAEKQHNPNPKESKQTADRNQKRKAREIQWQKRIQEQRREQTREKNRARLEYLADQLGLTPGQIARIESALANDLGALPQPLSDGTNASDLAFQPSKEDALDAALADIMTPKQELAYTDLKETEHAHRVEARTMQRFAALPETLNLSEQQRDQVYDLFAQEEAQAPENPRPVLGGLTLSMPNGDAANQSFVISLGSPVPSPVVTSFEGMSNTGPEDAFTPVQKATQQRNEDSIEAMRPFLNDRQLEAYRNHLDRSGGLIRTEGASFMEVKVLSE